MFLYKLEIGELARWVAATHAAFRPADTVAAIVAEYAHEPDLLGIIRWSRLIIKVSVSGWYATIDMIRMIIRFRRDSSATSIPDVNRQLMYENIWDFLNGCTNPHLSRVCRSAIFDTNDCAEVPDNTSCGKILEMIQGAANAELERIIATGNVKMHTAGPPLTDKDMADMLADLVKKMDRPTVLAAITEDARFRRAHEILGPEYRHPAPQSSPSAPLQPQQDA